jgi:hypothetical protein
MGIEVAKDTLLDRGNTHSLRVKRGYHIAHRRWCAHQHGMATRFCCCQPDECGLV